MFSIQAFRRALLFTSLIHAADIKSIYLFKDILLSNTTALKTSGFNSLLLFTVQVLENGDLSYPGTSASGETINTVVVSNGQYVGGSAYANKMLGFKTGDTTVNRVEVTLVSGFPTFEHIRDLVNKEGTGPSSTLYKNFAALKKAWGIDAINNDDEGVYDLPSTVHLALMLGQLGYKYSAAPYTNQPYWQNLLSQVNGNSTGLFDRVYLQCYDGGAFNDPADWQSALNFPIFPLLWVTNDAKPDQGKTPEQCRTQFGEWDKQGQLAGGGYWNEYDIEKQKSSYEAYAGVLNDIFE